MKRKNYKPLQKKEIPTQRRTYEEWSELQTNDYNKYSEERLEVLCNLLGVYPVEYIIPEDLKKVEIEITKEKALQILKGKKVANGTRMLVIPASREIYSKALDEGLLKIFVDAGALVSAPCCGPCLGGHTGIIGPGEVSLSTSNRNFKGRQGSPDGEVFLASAAVAAASAIEGRIVAPE